MAKDLTEALRQLTELSANGTTREDKKLPDPRQSPTIPPRTGTSQRVAQKTPTGGGVASPLVESAYADRTWHTTVTVNSSDGIFALKIKPVKTIKFADAASAEVVLEFKAPT